MGLTGLHSLQSDISHPLQCTRSGVCASIGSPPGRSTSLAFFLASLATRRAKMAPILVPIGARAKDKGSAAEDEEDGVDKPLPLRA